MNNLNISRTFECVKNIVDNIRCSVCDKADGRFMRYSCGHSACVDCVSDKEDCQICISIQKITSPPPKFDYALTKRVKNASNLLKACEDLFHTDVFNQKRLSEQLRIEKELFPKCIQATAKYENKRKSTSLYNINKGNQRLTYFPGEGTSPFKENIMENSVSYVQQWLHKNDKDFKRQPFRDLNVNSQLHSNIFDNKNNKSIQINKEQKALLLKSDRKRRHITTTDKSFSTKNRNAVHKYIGNSKKIKKELHQSHKVSNEYKCDKDESGIFMESEDVIVIDDSQEIIVDKDKNAWLAVLDANKYEESESTSVYLDRNVVGSLECNKLIPSKSDVLQKKENQATKVPFYKKSYITETCTYCYKVANKVASESNEVNITIDNKSFITSIKIAKLNNNKENFKFYNKNTSISTQTDITERNEIHHNNVKDDILIQLLNDEEKYSTQSEDLFADEGKSNMNKFETNNIHNGLVIEETDSDLDLDESGPLPVQVDVHRSCDELEYGILGEIVDIQEHDTKPRRGPRGLTPTSTDSSEKENFNPNRTKKNVLVKKKKFLKK